MGTVMRVTWEIDMPADTPREAACRAFEAMRRKDTTATVFRVEDADGGIHAVDLLPVIDYCQQVEARLHSQYGIGIGDVGETSVQRCLDDGMTAQECVEWLAEKHYLVRIETGP